MQHTKFRRNRPAGSGEEDFFIQNLVQIGTVVSEKIQLNFCMYTTLGQGQEMTLTFNTHISSFN